MSSDYSRQGVEPVKSKLGSLFGGDVEGEQDSLSYVRHADPFAQKHVAPASATPVVAAPAPAPAPAPTTQNLFSTSLSKVFLYESRAYVPKGTGSIGLLIRGSGITYDIVIYDSMKTIILNSRISSTMRYELQKGGNGVYLCITSPEGLFSLACPSPSSATDILRHIAIVLAHISIHSANDISSVSPVNTTIRINDESLPVAETQDKVKVSLVAYTTTTVASASPKDIFSVPSVANRSADNAAVVSVSTSQGLSRHLSGVRSGDRRIILAQLAELLASGDFDASNLSSSANMLGSGGRGGWLVLDVEVLEVVKKVAPVVLQQQVTPTASVTAPAPAPAAAPASAPVSAASSSLFDEPRQEGSLFGDVDSVKSRKASVSEYTNIEEEESHENSLKERMARLATAGRNPGTFIPVLSSNGAGLEVTRARARSRVDSVVSSSAANAASSRSRGDTMMSEVDAAVDSYSQSVPKDKSPLKVNTASPSTAASPASSSTPAPAPAPTPAPAPAPAPASVDTPVDYTNAPVQGTNGFNNPNSYSNNNFHQTQPNQNPQNGMFGMYGGPMTPNNQGNQYFGFQNSPMQQFPNMNMGMMYPPPYFPQQQHQQSYGAGSLSGGALDPQLVDSLAVLKSRAEASQQQLGRLEDHARDAAGVLGRVSQGVDGLEGQLGTVLQRLDAVHAHVQTIPQSQPQPQVRLPADFVAPIPGSSMTVDPAAPGNSSFFGNLDVDGAGSGNTNLSVQIPELIRSLTVTLNTAVSSVKLVEERNARLVEMRTALKAARQGQEDAIDSLERETAQKTQLLQEQSVLRAQAVEAERMRVRADLARGEATEALDRLRAEHNATLARLSKAEATIEGLTAAAEKAAKEHAAEVLSLTQQHTEEKQALQSAAQSAAEAAAATHQQALETVESERRAEQDESNVRFEQLKEELLQQLEQQKQQFLNEIQQIQALLEQEKAARAVDTESAVALAEQKALEAAAAMTALAEEKENALHQLRESLQAELDQKEHQVAELQEKCKGLIDEVQSLMNQLSNATTSAALSVAPPVESVVAPVISSVIPPVTSIPVTSDDVATAPLESPFVSPTEVEQSIAPSSTSPLTYDDLEYDESKHKEALVEFYRTARPEFANMEKVTELWSKVGIKLWVMLTVKYDISTVVDVALAYSLVFPANIPDVSQLRQRVAEQFDNRNRLKAFQQTATVENPPVAPIPDVSVTQISEPSVTAEPVVVPLVSSVPVFIAEPTPEPPMSTNIASLFASASAQIDDVAEPSSNTSTFADTPSEPLFSNHNISSMFSSFGPDSDASVVPPALPSEDSTDIEPPKAASVFNDSGSHDGSNDDGGNEDDYPNMYSFGGYSGYAPTSDTYTSQSIEANYDSVAPKTSNPTLASLFSSAYGSDDEEALVPPPVSSDMD